MTNTITPTSDQITRQKQLSFAQFVASKGKKQRLTKTAISTKAAQSALTEQTVDFIDADVRNSIFASIPARAFNRDIAIELLAEKLRQMAKTMDIAVTCIGFDSAQPATSIQPDEQLRFGF